MLTWNVVSEHLGCLSHKVFISNKEIKLPGSSSTVGLVSQVHFFLSSSSCFTKFVFYKVCFPLSTTHLAKTTNLIQSIVL